MAQECSDDIVVSKAYLPSGMIDTSVGVTGTPEYEFQGSVKFSVVLPFPYLADIPEPQLFIEPSLITAIPPYPSTENVVWVYIDPYWNP
tara:strand:- start:292 stop:558 length:267 start_codon:yes stop_codon:yes gene_type:complete